MTKAQRKIILAVLLVVSIIALFSIFEEWIIENKFITFSVAILFSAIISSLSKEKVSLEEGKAETNKIIENHPWIKIYMVSYAFVSLIGAGYVIKNNIKLNVGFFELFSAILLIILPILIIKTINSYKNASTKN